MSGGDGGQKPAGDEAEVDALLRAAQDAVLLKLQANSHLVSSSSSSTPATLDPAPGSLDDDLARRFDALKSRPPPPKRSDAASSAEAEARFAALKGGAARPEKETRVRLEDLGGESEDEDEVEKVMRWAMDSARLDVATAGSATAGDAKDELEDEEEDKSSAISEEDEDERLELEMEKKRKEMVSKNKPKNKWFFF